MLRRGCPDGERWTCGSSRSTRRSTQLVTRLGPGRPGDPGRDELLDRLVTVLREDVRDEEDELLPRLQERSGPLRLRLLGLAWEAVRRVAPTRPHPTVARRPPGNALAALPLHGPRPGCAPGRRGAVARSPAAAGAAAAAPARPAPGRAPRARWNGCRSCGPRRAPGRPPAAGVAQAPVVAGTDGTGRRPPLARLPGVRRSELSHSAPAPGSPRPTADLGSGGPMGRIVANFFISLDGVVERPDQWHFPYFDDEWAPSSARGCRARARSCWPDCTTVVAALDANTDPAARPPHQRHPEVRRVHDADRGDLAAHDLLTGDDVAGRLRAVKETHRGRHRHAGSATTRPLAAARGPARQLRCSSTRSRSPGGGCSRPPTPLRLCVGPLGRGCSCTAGRHRRCPGRRLGPPRADARPPG